MQMTREEFRAVKKSNDFSPMEKCELLGLVLDGSTKPGVLVSTRENREAWQKFCRENGVPVGGGGQDRAREFGWPLK